MYFFSVLMTLSQIITPKRLCNRKIWIGKKDSAIPVILSYGCDCYEFIVKVEKSLETYFVFGMISWFYTDFDHCFVYSQNDCWFNFYNSKNLLKIELNKL